MKFTADDLMQNKVFEQVVNQMGNMLQKYFEVEGFQISSENLKRLVEIQLRIEEALSIDNKEKLSAAKKELKQLLIELLSVYGKDLNQQLMKQLDAIVDSLVLMIDKILKIQDKLFPNTPQHNDAKVKDKKQYPDKQNVKTNMDKILLDLDNQLDTILESYRAEVIYDKSGESMQSKKLEQEFIKKFIQHGKMKYPDLYNNENKHKNEKADEKLRTTAEGFLKQFRNEVLGKVAPDGKNPYRSATGEE